MDKTVKNVLAAVGAVAVVKTAPVLALGAAIGAAATNMDKVKDKLVECGVLMHHEEASAPMEAVGDEKPKGEPQAKATAPTMEELQAKAKEFMDAAKAFAEDAFQDMK